MEYVVGEMEGFLGAPIYGMFGVEDRLKDYRSADGAQITGMPWGLIGPPKEDSVSGFEWTGEWTVTYETFRDMGLAFMAALLLIYGLIVWQFRDLALSGLIMAPIPLTLIGIIPGHWIMGAEFTATSMIGLIALGGIIVRQSILIVEFVKIEVAKGRNVTDAALTGAEIRMRPILITSLTTIGGAWTLMFDPIFQGMAVSVFFGASVGTLLAVIVIPLGCISMRRRFYLVETETGEIELSQRYFETEVGAPAPKGLPGGTPATAPTMARGPKPTPVWLRALLWVWGLLVSALFWLIGGLMGLMGRLKGLWDRRRSGGSSPSTPGGAPVGGSPAPAAGAPPVSGSPGLPTPVPGGVGARGTEAIRLPSFAPEGPTDVGSVKADLGEGVRAGASHEAQDPGQAAPPKKPRPARKTAPAKRDAAASATPSAASPVRKTRSGGTSKATPKKVAPAARPARRPKGTNGKARGLSGSQPGPLDPKSA
jgi:hypothetical protein